MGLLFRAPLQPHKFYLVIMTLLTILGIVLVLMISSVTLLLISKNIAHRIIVRFDLCEDPADVNSNALSATTIFFVFAMFAMSCIAPALVVAFR